MESSIYRYSYTYKRIKKIIEQMQIQTEFKGSPSPHPLMVKTVDFLPKTCQFPSVLL